MRTVTADDGRTFPIYDTVGEFEDANRYAFCRVSAKRWVIATVDNDRLVSLHPHYGKFKTYGEAEERVREMMVRHNRYYLRLTKTAEPDAVYVK